MTPAQLSSTVLRAVDRAVQAGELRVPVPERAQVTRPPRPGCGDYATNVALQLAKAAGQPPHSVARILRLRLSQAPGIAGVEIAGPGFLNITLDAPTHAAALVREVLEQGAAYGHGDAMRGEIVGLRFPYEVRAAVTAEVLARLLRAQAADVAVSPEGGQGGQAGQAGSPAAGCHWSALGLGGFVAPDILVAPDAPTSAEPGPGDRAGETVRVTPAPDSAPALLARLGSDATRWALLRPAAHDRPRPCGELLVQRESNPLFRIQYAHARVRALLRNAADRGVEPEPGPTCGAQGADAPLLAALAEYPVVLRSAARHRAPDRLARYLEELAGAFFRFHDGCDLLPRGDEKPLAAHRARTALARAAGTVLAGGLHLLGIHAPAHL